MIHIEDVAINRARPPQDTHLDTMHEFNALLAQIGDGVPDARQYKRMSELVLEIPQSQALARIDPFSSAYRPAAMELYLSLRGRPDDGYLARRDERPATPPPANLWTGLVPWSFGDAAMLSEHVHAWGHILSLLELPPGGSVLEYGPGSGQLLIMLARLGYHACGVDIDQQALDAIDAQARHLGLELQTECAEFGEGFGDRRFDCILFYESFHHAFEFEALLRRLHDRLNPGGRVILCGEPVVAATFGGIPYPWGPRLDALSVFCIRRFGWMELGFTRDYLMRIAQDTGWAATFHEFPACGRASLYCLTSAASTPSPALPASANAPIGRKALLRRLLRPRAWAGARRSLGRSLASILLKLAEALQRR